LENPFLAIRRSLGMPQAEFARVLGVSLPCLWAAERGGTTRPMAVLRALRAIGYDAQGLGQDYARWRAAQREAERLRLQRRLSARPPPASQGFRRLEAFARPEDGDQGSPTGS
jgi:transcriptional regulator with XRE-family HTH domain